MKLRGIVVILAVVVSGSVLASRTTVGATAPAQGPEHGSERSAFEPREAGPSYVDLQSAGLAVEPRVTRRARSAPEAIGRADPAEQPTSAETVPSPLPVRAQVAAPPAPVVAAPARTTAPAPAVAPAPTLAPAPKPAATAAPAPATCPKDWFCYPRLGIAGPIVPYTDCSGSTDVGTGIRSYTCLSDTYLMGHAYTQFGMVVKWTAGDQVSAWGRTFTVYGAVTEQSCAAPVFPLAALSLQTSLSSSACGPVLVVQAR